MTDIRFVTTVMDFGVAGLVTCRIGYTVGTVPVGIQNRVERQELEVINVIALKHGEHTPGAADITHLFEGDFAYLAEVVEQELKENAAAVTENYAELRGAA